MVDFVNNVRSFVNYAIFCELCDRMRFEVNCAKSHHRVISEGLRYEISLLMFNFISHSFAAPDQLAIYKHDRGVDLGSTYTEKQLQLSDKSKI